MKIEIYPPLAPKFENLHYGLWQLGSLKLPTSESHNSGTVKDTCKMFAVAPNWGFSGSGNQMDSFKFLSDPPLLSWQQADVILTKNRPLYSVCIKDIVNWLEIGVIVFYNICSKCPPFACTHARRRMHHSSIALSMMLRSTSRHTCYTLFQIVSVVHPRLVRESVKKFWAWLPSARLLGEKNVTGLSNGLLLVFFEKILSSVCFLCKI